MDKIDKEQLQEVNMLVQTNVYIYIYIYVYIYVYIYIHIPPLIARLYSPSPRARGV